MTDVITYEALYELLRKEKYNPDIQELDKDFFKKVIKYLEEKEQLVVESPKDSAFSKEITNTKKQVENAKKIIKELYERREHKIIQFALLSSQSGKKGSFPLLKEEEKLFTDMFITFNKYRTEILENILSNKQPTIKEEAPKVIKTEKGESENKLVRFVHPTPQFIAPDLKVYGPYEKEEMGLIPKRVAATLIKKKRAEEIKIEKK
jgi:DNA replication initiation complex subunit (GINS family)